MYVDLNRHIFSIFKPRVDGLKSPHTQIFRLALCLHPIDPPQEGPTLCRVVSAPRDITGPVLTDPCSTPCRLTKTLWESSLLTRPHAC